MTASVPPIEGSVPRSEDGEFPLEAFEKRYFSRFDHVDDNDAQCVLIHSNRICLVCISPEHPVVKEKLKVTKVNFQVKLRIL